MTGTTFFSTAVSVLGNPAVHTVLGAAVAAGWAFFQGSDWYKKHTNFLTNKIVNFAAQEVANNWHKTLRAATDANDPNLPQLQESAHLDAVAKIQEFAEANNLTKLPIVATKEAVDALVVQQVKALKAGNVKGPFNDHPTTKGM